MSIKISIMFNRIATLFAIAFFAIIGAGAETPPQATIKIRPKTNQGTTIGKPHLPAFIPIECSMDDCMLTISSGYPAVVNAEVYVTSTTEPIANYFTTEASETHAFYIEPQSDYLTIDIEVDGRMFTGEFFY